MKHKDGTCILVEKLDNLTESKVIKDEVSGDKKFLIEGIFMQSNIPNRNKRVYPGPLMDREANRYITEQINTNKAVGELNHPEEDMSINYEKVSHKITSLLKEGDNWIGKAVITKKTPMGALVAGLMEEGICMGVSSRATGSLKKQNDGLRIVQPDFRLITPADIVAEPSAPDAFVTNIMENKEWVFENGILIERDIEEIQELVNKGTRENKLNEEFLKQVFSFILKQKIGAKNE